MSNPSPVPDGRDRPKVTSRKMVDLDRAVAPGKLTDGGPPRRVHAWRIHRRTTFTLEDLAREVNPVAGWPDACAPQRRRNSLAP